MRLHDLRQTLSFLHNSWPQPDIVIFHVSGNDIGSRHTLDIISQLKWEFLQLNSLFPNTVLIFSEIVPRLLWLEDPASRYCEKIRKRINRALAKFMPSINGISYRHVDLEGGVRGLYRSDKVHLSDIALDIFNLDLQSCIELAVVRVGCQAHVL